MEDGPRGDGELVFTLSALELPLLSQSGDFVMSAPWAADSIGPAHLLDERPGLYLRVEFPSQFCEGHPAPPWVDVPRKVRYPSVVAVEERSLPWPLGGEELLLFASFSILTQIPHKSRVRDAFYCGFSALEYAS